MKKPLYIQSHRIYAARGVFALTLATLITVSGCKTPTQAPSGTATIQPAQEPAAQSRPIVPATTNVVLAWQPLSIPTNWGNTASVMGYTLLQGNASRNYGAAQFFPGQVNFASVTLSTALTNYLAVTYLLRVRVFDVAHQTLTTQFNNSLPSNELRLLPSFWIPPKGSANKLPTKPSTAQ